MWEEILFPGPPSKRNLALLNKVYKAHDKRFIYAVILLLMDSIIMKIIALELFKPNWQVVW